MRLSCKPQIIFCYIFSSLNVVNFWLDIENVILLRRLLQFLPGYSETLQVFLSGLNMCMTMAEILRLFLFHVYVVSTQSILAQLLPKHTETGYLVNTTPPTILPEAF